MVSVIVQVRSEIKVLEALVWLPGWFQNMRLLQICSAAGIRNNSPAIEDVYMNTSVSSSVGKSKQEVYLWGYTDMNGMWNDL